MRVLVIIDGLADVGDTTPLSAAATPFLDLFASHGCQGYHYPVGAGLAPESDVAVTALLGYDPYTSYTGRGPLEAFGARVAFDTGDLVLRCNFGTLLDGKLVDRRAGRSLSTPEAHKLAEVLNASVKLDYPFSFVSTTEHRGVLVIKGNFSDQISNVDPAYRREGTFSVSSSAKSTKVFQARPLDSSSKSQLAAAAVNAFVKESYRVLKDHSVNLGRLDRKLLPANVVLPRDAGVALPTFAKKKDWAAVVGMPLEKGLARCAGMRVLTIEYPALVADLAKRARKQLLAEIAAAKTHLKKAYFDSYYIHFKPIDVAGHDGDFALKQELLEILDKKFFKWLWKRKGDLSLVVTGDHATPCSLRAHSADLVPVLFYNGTRADGLDSFSELTCVDGSLGEMLGRDVLQKVGFE